MSLIVDTSFLLASLHQNDAKHAEAFQAFDALMREPELCIPAPVVYEVFYMLTVRVNYRRALEALDFIRTSDFRIELLTSLDYARMSEIGNRYVDARLDFTDMAIMAIAERLNIETIYTFDRRDFSIVKPKHCDYLKLLP
jgi:predicted nucleic acid-binding protein